jgi:subtilisin family serine protease
LAVAVIGLLAALTPPQATSTAAASAAPVIVIVANGTDPLAFAAGTDIAPSLVYREALNGFAATLTRGQIKALQRDARVVGVIADTATVMKQDPPVPVQPPQFLTTGLRRVGGLESQTAKIDGIDERVDADIAILDTGIDLDHPDLNVVGGINCVGGSPRGYDDHGKTGHGTLVAGFAAALDNSIGAVGVAPGARLWAVRVANANGILNTSWVLCGLEWLAANAETIEVANMSFGMDQAPTGPCGIPARPKAKADLVHAAICEIVADGVTVVVSAGNDAADAGAQVPAAYPEAIAVSALADSDGVSGALGSPPSCEPRAEDDHLAFFSNFGPVVDIAAPGVCISSTFIGGQYATVSGTSFSAPLVSGAAALVYAVDTAATPTSVRATLLRAAESGPVPGDPDNSPEPVLSVRNL